MLVKTCQTNNRQQLLACIDALSYQCAVLRVIQAYLSNLAVTAIADDGYALTPAQLADVSDALYCVEQQMSGLIQKSYSRKAKQ